ncbi:MAG: ATP-binding cassette domain-containing protein [Lachnospiraceae bacterium]|nr:ATP-binding cassette domain-containing protein [Lachnospiraceae bacterium]
MEKKKVLLSVRDLDVKFRVRGRILKAIRGISLDIYENESIAIVGESGSGKSVFTKTFAGMLDSNGFVSNGHIIFQDEELSDTRAQLNDSARRSIASIKDKLDNFARLEPGAAVYRELLALQAEKRDRFTISEEDKAAQEKELNELRFQRAEVYNSKTAMDRSRDKDKIKAAQEKISQLDTKIKELEARNKEALRKQKENAEHDTAYQEQYAKREAELKKKYDALIHEKLSKDVLDRNEKLAKEIYLSVARGDFIRRRKVMKKLMEAFKEAMKLGIDWNDEIQHNGIYDGIAPRVKYVSETNTELIGSCILDLAYMQFPKDWAQIRGKKIATVFQDPMTSLNPIITIGKQISSIIVKHQNCSEAQARAQALDLMQKVGIPNPVARYDDYPFQYSGGMRQRIVIAIALSCQPKILICDEPTTALDVTMQAQILQLIKDLQKEFNYTTVFITHDLGVVANIADRVAVVYGGQIIELGTVEDVFYEPRHPYTWALLSSLPQLAERNTALYSITGTPPSLYNDITGDAFAPRNPYCMKIDTLLEPPMFQVSDTHFAKTWLLDPDAPKIEKPTGICNLHERLMHAYNIQGV